MTNLTMEEVLRYQESVIESLRQENEKHSELEQLHNLEQMISKAAYYNEKLLNIKQNMLIIKSKTSRLKRRAINMLEDKNRDKIERQRSRERREILEKHLEPVVNTKGEH